MIKAVHMAFLFLFVFVLVKDMILTDLYKAEKVDSSRWEFIYVFKWLRGVEYSEQ